MGIAGELLADNGRPHAISKSLMNVGEISALHWRAKVEFSSDIGQVYSANVRHGKAVQ